MHYKLITMDAMNIKFRNYTEDDYENLKYNLVASQQFDDIWDSKKQFQGMIDQDLNSIILACDNKDRIIGSICVVQYGGETAQLFRLNVIEEFRQQGIGSMLLERAEIYAKERGFSEIALLAKSDKSNFYEKRGFEIFGDFTWMSKEIL